jgi:ribosomal-protein-alanine N-acetyltransferase
LGGPSFPEILTQRLCLRQLRPDDANFILQLRSDPAVNQFLDRKPATSLKDAETFIEQVNQSVSNGDSCYWLIQIKLSQDPVGTICLWDFSSDKLSAEIGYELLPQFQGKGFMQESLSPVIQYALEKLKLTCILASLHPENFSSKNLLSKNKFQFVEEQPGIAIFKRCQIG